MAQGPMSSILVTIRITAGSRSPFRIPKSAFTGLLKNLPTDFDEILRRTGVWPRDQLITFWCRSGSPSGSMSPKSEIRIHWIIDYAGIRRRSAFSEHFQLVLCYWQDCLCAAFSAGTQYANTFEVFLKFYRENESLDLEKLRTEPHGNHWLV